MASGNLQAIVYTRGSLKVLDQLKIPQESVYIDVPDSQRAWDVIRSMQVRGAPMIAMVAATGLACEVLTKHAAGAFADAAVACAHLLERMGHLKTARPTAVNGPPTPAAAAARALAIFVAPAMVLRRLMRAGFPAARSLSCSRRA